MKTVLLNASVVAVLLMAAAVFQQQAGEKKNGHRGSHQFHGIGEPTGDTHSLRGNLNASDISFEPEDHAFKAAEIKASQYNFSDPQHMMFGGDYLTQELTGIDDAIEGIRAFASYAGDASPDDYAKLNELEKKRWAALKRSMGKERYLAYFYKESNAGRFVSKTLSPLLIPEEEQIQILAKATHDGEVDEIDQDVLFDQISGSTKREASSTTSSEIVNFPSETGEEEPD